MRKSKRVRRGTAINDNNSIYNYVNDTNNGDDDDDDDDDGGPRKSERGTQGTGNARKRAAYFNLMDLVFYLNYTFFFISTLIFWLRLSVLSKISFSRLKCA